MIPRLLEHLCASLEIIWRPRLENKKLLASELATPIIFVIAITVFQYIVMKFLIVGGNDAATDLMPGDEYELHVPDAALSCFEADGTPLFTHCIGLAADSANSDLDAALAAAAAELTTFGGQLIAGQIVTFSDYEDARDRMMKWVGFGDNPCDGCLAADDFGYVLSTRSGVQPGEASFTIHTRDMDGIREFLPDAGTVPSHVLAAPAGYSDGTDVPEVSGTAIDAWRVYSVVSQHVAAIGTGTPSQPELTALSTLTAPDAVALGVLAHTQVTEQTLTSNAGMVTGAISCVMIPALCACFALVNAIHLSVGANRQFAQAGTHPLAAYVATLSVIAVHLAAIGLTVGLMYAIMPSIYAPLFDSEIIPVGDGVYYFVSCLLVLFLQAATFAAFSASRITALVVAVVAVALAPSIFQILTFQSTKALFPIFIALFPSALAGFLPDQLSSYRSLVAMVYDMMPGSGPVPKISIATVLDPEWPFKYVPEMVWPMVPENTRVVLEVLPAVLWVSIVVGVLYAVLLYVGLAVQPAEAGGAFRWSRLLTGLVIRRRSTEAMHTPEVPREGVDMAAAVDAAASQPAEIHDLFRKYHLKQPTPLQREAAVRAAAAAAAAAAPDQPVSNRHESERIFASGPRHYLAAVNGVSCTFERGRVTALLGVNGAGKTTLLRCLLGVERPTSGSVRVLGVDPHHSPTALLETLPLVGYVPQHNIVGKFSCRLHCELMARLRGLPGGQPGWRAEALRCLEAVGLVRDGKTEAMATTLSGGQKRRLMVAMAMVGRPPLLILDEPSAGLSVDAKVDLDAAIRAAAVDSSVIITEHDLDEVDGLADTLVIMRDGRVAACGTSLTLKEEYGAGYSLRCTLEPTTAPGPATRAIGTLLAEHDPLAHFDARSGRDLFFSLQAADALAPAGRALEGARATLGLASFAFDITTLDDVFLALAEGADQEPSPATTASPSDSVADPALMQPVLDVDSVPVELGPAPGAPASPSEAGVATQISGADNSKNGEVSGISSIVSGQTATPASWFDMLKLLVRKSLTTGARTTSVVIYVCVYIAISLGLSIAFMTFTPTIDSFRDRVELPLGSGPWGGKLEREVIEHLWDNNVEYFVCPEGDTPVHITGATAAAAAPCSWPDFAGAQAEIDTLMSRLSATAPVSRPYSELNNAVKTDHITHTFPLPDETVSIDWAATPPTLVEWRGPGRVVVYVPPEVLGNHLHAPAAAAVPLSAAVGAYLELVRGGYVRGDADLSTASLLLDDKYAPGGLPGVPPGVNGVETFANDPRRTTFMPVAFTAPFLGSFVVCLTSLMVIVLPYCMAVERHNSFAALLRLAGERRGVNLASWLLGPQAIFGLFGAVVGGIIVTLQFVITKYTVVSTGNAILYGAITGVGLLFSSYSWVLLGIWLGFRYRDPADVFKFVPLLPYVSLIITMSTFAWTVNVIDNSLQSITDSWSIFVMIAGLIPFTYGQIFPMAALFTGFFGSVFKLDFMRLSICTVVQVFWVVAMFVIVFGREEMEWGRGPTRSWVRTCLSFGKPAGTDSPHPRPRDYAKAEVDTAAEADPAVARHPAADAAVDAEAAFVAEGAPDSVVVFDRARREFVSADGTEVVVAVRGLSLALRRGECLGLVGENGAGKTTSFGLALGQVSCTSGSVAMRAKRVGWVPQHNAAHERLSVAEHLNLFATMSGISAERAHDIARVCGLEPHMAKLPGQLSGGYKRRLQLALALITSTELLVADEVAAGVDVHAQRAITRLMDELKNAGTSLIVTSHSMETVDRLASRVAVLTKGRLRTVGTPDSLKQTYSQGIQVTLQLMPSACADAAAAWLADAAGCAAADITTLPALGGDCRFIVPPTAPASVLDLLEATAPATRPAWIARAAVAPSTLQTVFLALEAESQQLELDNFAVHKA